MTRYYDGDTFERGGRAFKVTFPRDEFGRKPWEDDDGAGIVEEWRHTYASDEELAADGYKVLGRDRRHVRLYNWTASIAKATKDQWGLSDEDKATLKAKLGVKRLTRKRVIEEAVERDYERMRRWCNDQWCYVGVVVELVDEDGESDSLWGIESDCEDYLAEVAHELADEINHRLDKQFATAVEASRPDMHHP